MNNVLLSEFSDFVLRSGLNPDLFDVSVTEEELSRFLDSSPATMRVLHQVNMSAQDAARMMNERTWMERLVSDVHDVMQKQGHGDLIQRIVFAEFPTADFNACAFRLPSGYCVLLNRGVFRFMSGFTLLFTAITELTGSTRHGLSDAEVTDRLSQLTTLLSLMVLEWIGELPFKISHKKLFEEISGYQYWSDAKLQMRGVMLLSIELFILFHEVTHIARGHLRNKDSFQVLSSRKIRTRTHKHVFELEADDGAFEMLAAYQGIDISKRYFSFADTMARRNYALSADDMKIELGDEFEAVISAGASVNPELSFGCIPAFFLIADLLQFAMWKHTKLRPASHPHPKVRTRRYLKLFSRTFDMKPQEMPRGVQGILNTCNIISDPAKRVISGLAKT